MFGLSHRLWWPPELTEQLQITGRLFIYLYTSYINLYTPDQICAGFSSILSFKGGNNLLVFPRNFLGEKIPRGEDNPKSGWWFFLKLKPNPGITETLISQSQKPRFSVSVRVWCFFFSTDRFGNSPHVGSWLYEWRLFVYFDHPDLRNAQMRSLLTCTRLRCQPLVVASCWKKLRACHNVASLRNITKMPTSRNLSSDSFMHSFGSLWKTWSWSICLLTTLECMGKPFKKNGQQKTHRGVCVIWRHHPKKNHLKKTSTSNLVTIGKKL